MIQVATERGKVQRSRRGRKPESQGVGRQISNISGISEGTYAREGGDGHGGPQQQNQYDEEYDGVREAYSPDQISQYPSGRIRSSPIVRLDIDTHSMPPGSTERFQFEEMLTSDLTRILELGPNEQVWSATLDRMAAIDNVLLLTRFPISPLSG